MKQASSNFDGEKQQVREPSARSGPGHSTRSRSSSRSSRRIRVSTRNTNESSFGQGNRSQKVPDEVPGLADLIWKYFEAEVREALLEAQESLGDDNDNGSEQLSNGKRVGK